MRQTRRPLTRRGAVFVPVYTLHDMNQETRSQPVPVIVCTGCGHEIPAPNGRAAIQCRDCGKRMHVVPISPATQVSRANREKE